MAVVIGDLGAVEVRVDGRVVDVAPKICTLAAILASRSRRVVSLDELVEYSWFGEDPPKTAMKTMHGNVARLRRAIGHDAVLSYSRGYRINLDVVTVESTEFERAVTETAQLHGEHRYEAANDCATRAELLWCGEPYDRQPEEILPAGTRMRLRELHNRIRELRIDAVLALGRPQEVIAELESIVAADLLREEFWAQLAIALYNTGRSRDALHAIGRARRTLSTELGLEPGPTLQVLESKILQGQPLAYPVLATPSLTLGHSSAAAPLGRARTTDRFVGRAHELAVGRDALRGAGSGVRRTLLIGGPPGIGKTRLLEEVLQSLPDGIGRVIGARNDESTYRPYGAVLRLLSQVGAESEELPEDADGLLARRLVRLRQGSLPTGNEIFEGPTGAEIERRLTAEAVHRLLELEAHVRGLLVVAIEDAQWADQGTLDVVREIGTAAAAAPLLMIVTYRDTPRSPGLAAALHALDREVSSHRIDLSPFTVDEIHELAGDPAPGFVDAVMRRTDGNPLLVSELLRSPGRAVDTLPSGVRDLVDSWLASCDPDAITFAEVAGLIGRTFNPYVAYTALRGKPGRTITENARLGAIVEQLRASGLVRDAERGTDLQFTHDLFREAVLARLPSSDTRNGHRRIVDVLEADNGDDLDALVHHSVGGELADKAASHLRTRSLRSLQSGLVEEAVADASAAQRWLENCDAVDPERSIELGLVIADALALAARGPEAEGELRRLLVMAEHLSGSSAIRLRSAIHRRRARIHLAERRLPEAIAAIEQSVNLIGSDVPVDATLIDEWIESFLAVSSLDYYSAHGVPWAIGWIDRLNEPVLRHGSVRQRVQYFSNMGPVLNMDTRYTGPQNIIDVVRDQLVAAAELGDASLIASAKFGNGFVHFCRLDGRIAAPFFDDAVRRYEHIADRLWVEIGHVYRAMCERLLGNLAETARRSEAALVTSATLVPPAYLAMLETNLAWCEHRSGGDARPLVRSALDRFDAPTASTYPFKGFALWLALALAHADGRRDEVRRLAEALVHPFQRALPPDVEQLVRSVASASSSARVEGDLKRVLVWARERHFV